MDSGSQHFRAGFAGDDAITSFFPNRIGRPPEGLGGLLGATEEIIGEGEGAGDLSVMVRRGMMKEHHPVVRGLVEDWDGMTRVWRHALGARESPGRTHRAGLQPKGGAREDAANLL